MAKTERTRTPSDAGPLHGWHRRRSRWAWFQCISRKKRLFVEGACALASQLAAMSSYSINSSDDHLDDAVATMNSLVEKARTLGQVTPTLLHYYAAARDDGWDSGDEDSPQEYCRTAQLSKKEIMSAHVEDWREEYDWWKNKP